MLTSILRRPTKENRWLRESMVALNDSTLLNLKPAHIKDLESSGLIKEQMALVGHFSVRKQQAQDHIGYALAGLIFVYSDLDGEPYLKSDGKPFYRIKPDWEEDSKTQKSPKYLSPRGQGNRPYFSRAVNWNLIAKRPEVDLFEVEGEKKLGWQS